MRRTVAIAGLGLFVAAGLTLTACGSSAKPAATPSPSAAASMPPADALDRALGELKTEGYNVTTMDSDSSGTGVAEPSTNTASFHQESRVQGANLTAAAVESGGNRWIRLDLGPAGTQFQIDPNTWYAVDATKLTNPDSWPLDPTGMDPFGVSGVLAATSDVHATDPTHLTGTVDLTQSTGPAKPDASELSQAGAAAKTTPFAATLDEQGRLTALTINADGYDKALTRSITFADYGSPTPIVTPSPSAVQPAPASLYQLLNSG